MLPLLGVLAILLIGLISAGVAAGNYYNKRRWKNMKRHNKIKKRSRSPSDEIEEDLELGHEHKSIETDKSEKPNVTSSSEEEIEEDVVEELMKVHNLLGPTRFLFTIEEETTQELRILEDEKKPQKKTLKSLIGSMGESDVDFPKPISCPVIKSTRSLTGSVFDQGNVLVNGMFDCSKFRETPSFSKLEVVAAR